MSGHAFIRACRACPGETSQASLLGLTAGKGKRLRLVMVMRKRTVPTAENADHRPGYGAPPEVLPESSQLPMETASASPISEA